MVAPWDGVWAHLQETANRWADFAAQQNPARAAEIERQRAEYVGLPPPDSVEEMLQRVDHLTQKIRNWLESGE